MVSVKLQCLTFLHLKILLSVLLSLVMGKFTSDPVMKHDDNGSMDLGKCQPVPLNNSYQLLETLQDDQASTSFSDRNTY